MREGLPSLTAAFVAFARGVGTHGDVPDPVARALLPQPVSYFLRALGRRPEVRLALRPALRGATLGLVDHVTLRTAAIDRAVREGVGAGIEQIVVLGAGLDARAWRMRELACTDVFEVDHPSTQQYKRTRVERMRPVARSVRFVSVDFERQRLGRELEQAGHDPSRATFWIWEGVTPYLRRTPVIATLGEIAARSAEASRIAVTYVLPELPVRGTARRVVELGFEVLGEPVIGGIPSGEMASLLEGASFRLLSDTDSASWAREFGTSHTLPALFRAERLAVASHRAG